MLWFRDNLKTNKYLNTSYIVVSTEELYHKFILIAINCFKNY